MAAAGTAPGEEGNGQEMPGGSTLRWWLSRLSGVLCSESLCTQPLSGSGSGAGVTVPRNGSTVYYQSERDAANNGESLKVLSTLCQCVTHPPPR